MRRKPLTLVIYVTAIIALIAAGRMMAAAQPGGAGDPLVTKKYVDDRINALWDSMHSGGGPVPAPGAGGNYNEIFADVIAYIETVYGGALRQPQEESRHTPYEAVFIEEGKSLIGFSGTEMVLRSGRALAVTGFNGLLDVTLGADIINGTEISPNHLLVVPAGDGRGLRFLTGAWVMVKGGYYIAD